MKLRTHSFNRHTGHLKVALAVMLAVAAAGQNAVAQSAGSDQDGLLPPEVVPLDPSTANSMSAAETAQRQMQAGMNGAQNGAVPGLVGSGSNQSMSAQDMRQAAFSQLYGQGQNPLQSGASYMNGMPQNGNMPQGNGMFNPNMPSANGNAPGMSPWINPALQAPYQGSVVSNVAPPQSQTLTGGSNNQQQIQNTRRGGITNTVSGLTGIAMTGLMLGYMMKMNPANALMGVGMFGVGSTGFGVRNGFRF